MKIGKVRLLLVSLMLISLGFLVRGYTHLWDISNWATVNGKIVSYESGTRSITSYSKYSMQGVDSMGWSRIEYEYIVDDVSYTGRRISPNIKTNIAYIKKEEKTPVFYNPAKHSESYLLAQRYHNPLLVGLFVASIVGLGVDLIYYGKRDKK